MSINITVICSIHTNTDLLRHFIDHYKKLGVTYFVLGIWRGKENPIWHEITDLKDDSITLLKSYDSPFDGALDREFINTVRQNFVDIDGWYIPTDLDEFHVFPKHENIKSLIDEMNRTQSDFVSGEMVDRITLDGSIPPHILATTSIWEQFPKNGNITGKLLSACNIKISLIRQRVKTNTGHHFPEHQCVKFKDESVTYHFKWFGNLLEKEEIKLHRNKSLGYDYYVENEKLISILKQNGGKIII